MEKETKPNPGGQDGFYAEVSKRFTKDYKLPVCDTQREKRNFPGYKEQQPFTLLDMKDDGPGTTDTDFETHGKQSGPGYTKIYGGKPYGRLP